MLETASMLQHFHFRLHTFQCLHRSLQRMLCRPCATRLALTRLSIPFIMASFSSVVMSDDSYSSITQGSKLGWLEVPQNGRLEVKTCAILVNYWGDGRDLLVCINLYRIFNYEKL